VRSLGTWSISRAIRGKPCPRARRRWRRRLGLPTRSVSFWTGSGLPRIGWQKIAADSCAISVWNERLQRFGHRVWVTTDRLTENRRWQLCNFCLKRTIATVRSPLQFLSETNGCNGSVTVATVQTEPLQPFGWVRTILTLPERYK